MKLTDLINTIAGVCTIALAISFYAKDEQFKTVVVNRYFQGSVSVLILSLIFTYALIPFWESVNVKYSVQKIESQPLNKTLTASHNTDSIENSPAIKAAIRPRTNDDQRWKSSEKESKDQIPTRSEKAERITNNGNLSIGQTGGVVNQNTVINPKPASRQLTNGDVEILSEVFLCKGCTVEITIPQNRPEAIAFAQEIGNYILSRGINAVPHWYTMAMPGDAPPAKFYILKRPASENRIGIYIPIDYPEDSSGFVIPYKPLHP
jgi:hypothetical protein